MITATGEYTLDDYLKAQRFHAKRRTLAIAGILLGMAGFMWAATGDRYFAVVVLTYLGVLRPIMVRWRLKRNWAQTPSAHEGVKSYGFDETGFHCEDDEGNTAVAHWDKFLRFRESRHTFFLYLSPILFLYVPKRLLAPQDQEAFRQLARDKAGHWRARPTASLKSGGRPGR